MEKIIEGVKLHHDLPMSMKEWIEMIPKNRSDNQPDAFQVGYDYIKQNFSEDIHLRLKIEEMNIGEKVKLSFNHFLIRIK